MQLTLKHAEVMPHFTSHAHELPHVMLPHELLPVQFTEQAPAPHWMPRHEKLPVHSMLHDCPAVQL
ncbi:MAG TPA: hypothetical protein VK427_25415, partial [Kofleriaceae bacterium]|nr:hypothetical protein [Kofleriaceae bacterium]